MYFASISFALISLVESYYYKPMTSSDRENQKKNQEQNLNQSVDPSFTMQKNNED